MSKEIIQQRLPEQHPHHFPTALFLRTYPYTKKQKQKQKEKEKENPKSPPAEPKKKEDANVLKLPRINQKQ